MKILINKHIVMFVCILNCFAENWLILTASICSRSSLFTSTRMHVEMIMHALTQTDIQARTKSPDPQKHQTRRYIVSINLIHMQHYIWHVWRNPDNLQIWGCRDWYGKKVSLNPVSGNFFSENMGPASTWSHGRFSVTVNRSRTLKFWSATMFGAAARNFGPVHKFELPTVIADSVPQATRIFSLISVGHVTGHMVSHMVPMARCRPPYWKIFTVNNLATVF